MKLCVMSIFDARIDAFGTPMFFTHRGAGIRAFQDEVARVDANNQLYKHPEDFSLYVIAEFDDQSGEFQCPGKERVALATDFAPAA